MKRALSPAEVLRIKHTVIPFSGAWERAFSQPEACGVWFVYGKSGNGKSSFVMQLTAELSNFGKVGYNSLEEGFSLTFKNTIQRSGLTACRHKVCFYEGESMSDLSELLRKPKSPKFVIIDSVQYTEWQEKEEYFAFVNEHKCNKVLIFVSQMEDGKSKGAIARAIEYDASLKILVQGHRAISKGRFIGDIGYYTVWSEAAEEYWGNKRKG